MKKGFSLIELMIVIAIIGILAAIAIPSYQTYVSRSRFAELLSVGHTLEIAVADFIMGTGATIGQTGACDSGSFTAPTISSTTNVLSGTVAATTACTITVVGQAAVFNNNPPTVTITPSQNSDGSISWACSSGGYQGAPSTCP